MTKLNISAVETRSLRRTRDAFARKNDNSDLRVFFLESLRSLGATASLVPSSRFLAAALLRSINFDQVTTVVELGVGTGAVTSELLRRLSPHAKLYALDINPTFISHVRKRIHDERLVPVLGRAENLGAILRQHGVERADAIVSSLGLTAMNREQRSAVMNEAVRHLAANGVLSQFQYLLSNLGPAPFSAENFLRGYFRTVYSEKVLRNIPPAAVYTCWA